MIASPALQGFFSKVFNTEEKPRDLARLLVKDLKPVADELFIGKLTLSVAIPATFCDMEHVINNDVLYEKIMYVGDQAYTNHYELKNCGKLYFTANVQKNHTWTDAEIADVEFLFQVLFAAFSRSRLLKLITNAEHTDPLTGVYNTSGIEYLGSLIAKKKFLKKFTVIFFNICKFHSVNDEFGSKTGDEFLRLFSVGFRDFIGKDGAIGRLGGDNFAIIVKTSRISEIIKYMTNLHVILDLDDGKKILNVTLKAGVFNCEGMKPNVPFEFSLAAANSAFKVARSSDVEDIVFFKPEMMPKDRNRQ